MKIIHNQIIEKLVVISFCFRKNIIYWTFTDIYNDLIDTLQIKDKIVPLRRTNYVTCSITLR